MLGKRFRLKTSQSDSPESSTALRQTRLAYFSKFFPSKQSIFWALQGVDVETRKGEFIGLAGPNGSGKSTFLKTVSRVLTPDQGWFETRGRVIALLNGTGGFQSELTGRANIYLIGAYFGIPHQEMKERFDAIVDFSRVRKFLDIKIKHYSQGMGSRLAMAVAFQLSPDLLFLDEVLSSSDQGFREKSLKQIQKLSENGTTVILVSHERHLIRQTCQRVILFEEGRVIDDGKTESVMNAYDKISDKKIVNTR